MPIHVIVIMVLSLSESVNVVRALPIDFVVSFSDKNDQGQAAISAHLSKLLQWL